MSKRKVSRKGVKERCKGKESRKCVEERFKGKVYVNKEVKVRFRGKVKGKGKEK